MEENKQANNNEIKISLSDEMAQGTYANLAVISHSASEFIFDFIRVVPGSPTANVKSRIIMTPKHAKRLLHALSDNIQKYESHFGPIDLSDKRPNQNEATFNLGDLAAFNNGTKS